MLDAVQRRAEEGLAEHVHELNPEEAAVLALLQQRLLRPPAKPVKSKRARASRASTDRPQSRM